MSDRDQYDDEMGSSEPRQGRLEICEDSLGVLPGLLKLLSRAMPLQRRRLARVLADLAEELGRNWGYLERRQLLSPEASLPELGADEDDDYELVRASMAEIFIEHRGVCTELLGEADDELLSDALRLVFCLRAADERLVFRLARLRGHEDARLSTASLLAEAAFRRDEMAPELARCASSEGEQPVFRVGAAAAHYLYCDGVPVPPEAASLMEQAMRGELGQVLDELHRLPFGIHYEDLGRCLAARAPELFAEPILGRWRELDELGREHWLHLARCRHFAAYKTRTNQRQRDEVHIDGRDIVDLTSFFCAFGEAINGPGGYFGADLGGFDDCLFGGFGLEVPCTIVWDHADASRTGLDAGALVVWCREKLQEIAEEEDDELFDQGKRWLENTLTAAERGERSLFDVVVEGIRSVPERADYRYQLKLELR